MTRVKHDVGEMYFSQHALGTYDTCFLKFRRRYIDRLYWPGTWVGDPKQMKAVEEGQLFHLLANRYYSGIPAGHMEGAVRGWYNELISFRPREQEALYLPEQEIRLNVSGIRLVVKLDLLMVLPDGRAVIYDWKTTSRKPGRRFYARNIQTIVYRYVLARAGGAYSPLGKFLPEDISMIYWNPRFPDTVEPLGYTEKDYLRDESIIRQKIREIENRKYEEFYASGDTKKCNYCEYTPICHGNTVDYRSLEETEDELDLDWDDIEEFVWE